MSHSFLSSKTYHTADRHWSLRLLTLLSPRDCLSLRCFSLGKCNVCIYVCVAWSKSTGLLCVFKVVHLLPDLSRCLFLPPSFLLPVRQHMSHSITSFICSSLSSSSSLSITAALPVLAFADWTPCLRCRQNPDQLQFTSKQRVESRADSPLLFSSQLPSLNPWFLALVLSFHLRFSASSLYCALRVVGVVANE